MTEQHKTSVLVIDDSILFTRLLTEMINSFKGFTVCGSAENVFVGKKIIDSKQPGIIVLDVEMPKIDGITFIKQLVPQYTVPIIVCSSKNAAAKDAMYAGAVNFISKPSGTAFDKFKIQLEKALISAKNIKRIKCCDTIYNIRNHKAPCEQSSDKRLIVFGGSAGSTEALPTVLKSLNPDIPPIAVTIHLPAGYTSMYAKRLNNETDFRCVEAYQGLYLKKGMLALAPGDRHLRIFHDNKGYFCSIENGQKVSGHAPSVDVLFESCAVSAGSNAVGIILTGMGSDGAVGLLKMRNAGAYTIGQDQSTSTVYGMPKSAYMLGAVCVQRPLDKIAPEIKLWIDRSNKKA